MSMPGVALRSLTFTGSSCAKARALEAPALRAGPAGRARATLRNLLTVLTSSIQLFTDCVTVVAFVLVVAFDDARLGSESSGSSISRPWGWRELMGRGDE